MNLRDGGSINGRDEAALVLRRPTASPAAYREPHIKPSAAGRNAKERAQGIGPSEHVIPNVELIRDSKRDR